MGWIIGMSPEKRMGFLNHGVEEAEKANRGDNASMCTFSRYAA